MLERLVDLLWVLAIATMLVVANVRGDGTPYLYTVLGVALTFSLLSLFWPNWIGRMPSKYLPAFTGFYAFLVVGWMAWTVLTPTLTLAVKVTGVAVAAGIIVYQFANTFKEKRDSRVTVNIER